MRRLPAHYDLITVLARRPAPPGLPADGRVVWRRVDFDHLPEPLDAADAVYIALGTTMRAAGSEAAFRRVDQDAVVAVARAARLAGATRLAVVSALGADPASRAFYNRVKGEMEGAIAALGYSSVVIAQPSLLLGDRHALGQPLRRGELLASRLLRPLSVLLPKRLRPIQAERVAEALLQASLAGLAGVQRLTSAQMQELRPGRGAATPPPGTAPPRA